jgi:hypothetical protein
MDAIAFDRIGPPCTDQGPEPEILLGHGWPDHVDRQNGRQRRRKARGERKVTDPIRHRAPGLRTENMAARRDRLHLPNGISFIIKGHEDNTLRDAP